MWWRLLLLVVMLVACGGDDKASNDQDKAPPQVQMTSTHDLARHVPIPHTMVPTSISSCVPNPEWHDTYVVQVGDTLGAIAINAGVTIKDMQEGNCLSNRDMLFVGQILQVPNAFSLNVANSPVGMAGVITFVRQDAEGQRHLWIVRSDGSALRQITREQHVVNQPVRSYDLNWIAFQSMPSFYDLPEAGHEVPTDIWTVGADGNALRSIADQGPNTPIFRSSPAWSSADGNRLAFIEQQGTLGSLVTIQPDGLERTVVMSGNFVPPDRLQPITPAWSPDGTQLAVIDWDNEVGGRLLLVPDQARTTDVITVVEGLDYWDGPYWVPLEGEMGVPALAYATTAREWWVVDIENGVILSRSGGLALTHPLLGWRVQMQSTGLRLVGPLGVHHVVLPKAVTSVSWAPEGVQLVVGQGQGGLLLLDLEDDLQLPVTPGYDLMPAWTPPRWLLLP